METLSLNANQWLTLVSFGALLGAVGQMLRVIPGLKKLNDESRATGVDARTAFSPATLIVSLLLGALAGVLGAISLGIKPDDALNSSVITQLMAIGYAGSDFIEAFMQKRLPGSDAVVPPAGGDDKAKTPPPQPVG
jgi:hypothetical protein